VLYRTPGATFATVIVDTEQARFVVHECLLTHHSEFFRAALTGRFKEAEEKAVALEEVEPATFGFFVHWLYNRHFPCREQSDDPATVNAFYHEEFPDHEASIELYIFGDKYNCRDLRKAAIDLLFTEVVTNNTGLIASVDGPRFPEPEAWRPLVSPFCRYDGRL
jgi:hypothetical protein